jgi:hypothetical protein
VPVSAIDVTPGSAAANAYVTIAVADQYHLDRPAVGTTWATATTDQKTTGILWATKLLDALWEWNGYPTDAIQALLWPRTGVWKRNKWEEVPRNIIPIELQQATAEYARQLLVSDRAGDSDIETVGLKSLTAGPVSLAFKDSVFAKPVPDAVINLIPCEWGYVRGRNTGVRNLLRA